MQSRLRAADFRLLVIALLVLSALASFASTRSVPDAPISQLIRSSIAANTVDWKAQVDYSYQERDDKSKIDSPGQVHSGQSRTFAVTMLAGTPYHRLIAIQGEPLNPGMQHEEAIKFERELSRRQRESASQRAARISKFQNERSEEHLLMQQMTAAFKFAPRGEENLDGVDCYTLDATPDPDYNPPVEKARVLTGMKGRLWITKAGHHWAKVEAEVISPVEFGYFIAKVKPGTRFELERSSVYGVWLPKRFSQTINASVLGVFGMRSLEEEIYSAYQEIGPSTAAGARTK